MEDNAIYKVVVNDKNDHSIYPKDRLNALGWRDGGFYGNIEDCMSYLKKMCENELPVSSIEQQRKAKMR